MRRLDYLLLPARRRRVQAAVWRSQKLKSAALLRLAIESDSPSWACRFAFFWGPRSWRPSGSIRIRSNCLRRRTLSDLIATLHPKDLEGVSRNQRDNYEPGSKADLKKRVTVIRSCACVLKFGVTPTSSSVRSRRNPRATRRHHSNRLSIVSTVGMDFQTLESLQLSNCSDPCELHVYKK